MSSLKCLTGNQIALHQKMVIKLMLHWVCILYFSRSWWIYPYQTFLKILFPERCLLDCFLSALEEGFIFWQGVKHLAERHALGLGAKLLLPGLCGFVGGSAVGCSNMSVASSAVALAKELAPVLRKKLCRSLGTSMDTAVMVIGKD